MSRTARLPTQQPGHLGPLEAPPLGPAPPRATETPFQLPAGPAPERVGPTPTQEGPASHHACPIAYQPVLYAAGPPFTVGSRTRMPRSPQVQGRDGAEPARDALAQHARRDRADLHPPHPPPCLAQPCPQAPGFRSLLPRIGVGGRVGRPGGRDLRAKELRLLDPQVSVGQDQSGGSCVYASFNRCAPEPGVPTLSRAPGLFLAHWSDRLNHARKSFTSWTRTSQNCFLSLPWPLGNSG